MDHMYFIRLQLNIVVVVLVDGAVYISHMIIMLHSTRTTKMKRRLTLVVFFELLNSSFNAVNADKRNNFPIYVTQNT